MRRCPCPTTELRPASYFDRSSTTDVSVPAVEVSEIGLDNDHDADSSGELLAACCENGPELNKRCWKSWTAGRLGSDLIYPYPLFPVSPVLSNSRPPKAFTKLSQPLVPERLAMATTDDVGCLEPLEKVTALFYVAISRQLI